jgi:hypothetical protein
MRKILLVTFLFAVAAQAALAESLPFSTVFKGQDRFARLVSQARETNWRTLPIGERTAAVGYAMTGTPYKNYTLEIDDRIEAPSVNMNAMDCWTFFEIALAFARMIEEPEANWTPERMLHYIELDRYRGGKCDGTYLSPKSQVPAIEGKLRNGDIIGIVGRDGRNGYATSHVGLAYRTDDGVLHFMHASAPRNYGKVLVDARLSSYLNKYSSHSGIMVGRPVR